MLDCIECGKPLGGGDSAVGWFTDSTGEEQFTYIDFVEDLRARFRLIHPVCFIAAHGAAAFVNVVHDRDAVERGAFSKLHHEQDALRREVASLENRLRDR